MSNAIFEAEPSSCDEIRRLRQRLQKVVKPGEDDVRFYFLCEACVPKMKLMGGKREPVRQDFYLF